MSCMTGEQPATIEPDTKDWTWTLGRACPECGFEAAAVEADEISERTLALTRQAEAAGIRDVVG